MEVYSTELTESTEKVEWFIYNIKDQRVRTLTKNCHPEPVEGSVFNDIIPSPSTTLRMTQAGSNTYKVIWNGTDDNNQPVSSSIYFYKLKAGKEEQIRKMLLLR